MRITEVKIDRPMHHDFLGSPWIAPEPFMRITVEFVTTHPTDFHRLVALMDSRTEVVVDQAEAAATGQAVAEPETVECEVIEPRGLPAPARLLPAPTKETP